MFVPFLAAGDCLQGVSGYKQVLILPALSVMEKATPLSCCAASLVLLDLLVSTQHANAMMPMYQLI
jgi:hypothetical protein